MPEGLTDNESPRKSQGDHHPRYEAPMLTPLGNARELLAGGTGSIDDVCEGGQQFSGNPNC
jgi:hypothetical protein